MEIALEGSFTAVFLYWTSKESDARCTDGAYEMVIQTVWSFCRFLHFVTTIGGLNSLTERLQVVDVPSQYKTTIRPKLSWLELDPRQFGSFKRLLTTEDLRSDYLC